MQRVNFLNISLYQMQMFLAICECKNFTTASQIFNTTQSAVSKSMASMESVLGFRLFIRNKNKLELTDPGRLLYKEWQTVVQDIELSVDKAYLLNERGKKNLIIGEPDSMKTDMDYLTSIERFQQENPKVILTFMEMQISDLISKLVSNELDAIFTIDYEVPTLEKLGIHWATVAESPFVTITMHETNPLAAKDKISMSDLKDEDFIVMSPTLNQNYVDLMFELCKSYGFTPKISVKVANARSMITTLLRTRTGVVMGSRFLYDADSPHLRSFNLENTYSRLIIAWKDNPAKPDIKKFIDSVSIKNKR